MGVEHRMLCLALVLIAMLVPPLVISSRRFGFDPPNPPEKLEAGDPLHIVANTVLSYEASCERYSYFYFPFCPPGEPIINKRRSLEEVLEGDCHKITKYELRFLEKTQNKILCEKSLTKDELARFKFAIERDSFYEMTYNNLVLRENVGYLETESSSLPLPRYLLFTHIDFHISYSENKVTDMYIASAPTNVDITKAADIKVNFSYSVYWFETKQADVVSLTMNETLHYKEDQRPTEDDERWMSWLVFWTNVTLIWVGLLLMVTLPYLVKYLMRTRCSNGEEGYSQHPQHIHGGSCICPRYTSLLGAILGNGIQLFISICIFFILAYKGFLHPCNLQSLSSQILWTFCLTSTVAAYKATAFHTRFTPFGWKECTFQAGAVYFVPVLTTAFIAYGLAATRSDSSGVPELDIICGKLIVWGLVTVILLSLGGTLAHCSRPESEPPCTTRRLPRGIPQKSWHRTTPAQMLFGAILPSLAIGPEMDNIYASLWNFKICGAFYVMLTSFIMLIILTAVVAVGCTTEQFTRHDYQWWWKSVFRGGSTAIFIFFYGIYFFSRVPDIEDDKLIRFLGYNACISYALFLILGTVGFYASSFVFHNTFPSDKHE